MSSIALTHGVNIKKSQVIDWISVDRMRILKEKKLRMIGDVQL